MKESKIPLLGIFLIVLGSLMLLDRLDVVYLGWGRILWLVGAAAGAAFAVEGFVTKRQARVFWGSFLFYASALFLARLWRLIDFWGIPWVAFLSLALGLAFFMLFVYDPRNVGILIPALIFGGFGATVFLVEWDYLDWWDVRYYIRNYWPVLLILLGFGIILKRKPQASSQS
jgi:hypothetical protein